MQVLYRSLRDKKVHVDSKLRRGSWIRVESPNQTELDTLIKDHALDPVIVQDALDPYEVPRIEREDDNLYIIVRLPVEQSKDQLTQPPKKPSSSYNCFSSPPVNSRNSSIGLPEQLVPTPLTWKKSKIRISRSLCFMKRNTTPILPR